MSKASGINKQFLSITAKFKEAYQQVSEDIGLVVLAGSLVSKKLIEKKVVKVLTPIISDYFNDSIHASNLIVGKEVSKLVDDIGLPFKYNKTFLDKMNEKSIFAGYADNEYKSFFTKREITSLKKVILSAKYSGWDEKQLVAAIKNTVNITNNRALLLARTETTRLDSVAKEIYFGKKKVRDEYELVWIQTTAYERHKHMNGVVADENGKFYDSKTGGVIPGPPYIFSPWNCKCRVEYRKKEE